MEQTDMYALQGAAVFDEVEDGVRKSKILLPSKEVVEISAPADLTPEQAQLIIEDCETT
ncbi:hypothetical protein AB0H73_06435 [Streptomyces olivoreticuli]